MKAAFIEHFGGPEVWKGDLPDPVAAAGEVVVDVVAASVNGADWKVRSGQYSQAMFPLVLGRDFSGLVAAVFWSFPSMLIANARSAFTV
jgi:NADPH:quinone reductase-like Zn-dependent oxidoreductase